MLKWEKMYDILIISKIKGENMRKILLITLMLVLACALAISVGATTIYKDENGNELFSYETESVTITPSENGNATFEVISSYKGEFAKADENGTPLTWYIKSTEAVDGNTVYTVASLPTVETEGYDSYAGTINSNGAYNYVSSINKKNVVSANFPDNAGILSFGFGAFGGYGTRVQNRLLFCYMPNTITVLDDSIFQETPVLVVEMDDEAPITVIPHKFAHQARSLRSIHIPASVEIIKSTTYNNGVSFYQTYCLESVTFSEKSQLKTIEQFAFAQSGVKYITLPDCLETLGNKAFIDSGIVNSPFTENSRCTTWGNHIFRNCDSLKNFIIPGTLSSITKHDRWEESSFALSDNIELITYGKGATNSTLFAGMFAGSGVQKVIFPEGVTHIPGRMFSHCTAIKEVSFPNSVETIGERVFQNSRVEIIRLGANFKYFSNSLSDHHSFTYAANNIKEIYIPASFYKEAPDTVYQVSYAFNCGNSSNIKFYYTGTQKELTEAINNFKSSTKSVNENNFKFLSATQISYADYIASEESYQNGNYIIYDYNVCDAFYEGKHQLKTEISYTSYSENGEKTTTCMNKGCTHTVSDVAYALFSYNGGYSTPLDGGDSIVVKLIINREAIKEYELITGKTLQYGMFAVTKDKLGANDVLNADGSAINGAIKADVSNGKYVAIELKLNGFETEIQRSTKLALGAYLIISDNESKEITYLQYGKASEGDKYSFISYNDVLSIQP